MQKRSDNLTPEQRKKNMQRIRSMGTKPECILTAELKKLRFKFSCNDKSFIGIPDIVFRTKRVIVFVDSDFWHGHKSRFVMPKTNVQYWKDKIEKNKIRDMKVTRKLRKEGWAVLRLWEYDIEHNLDCCVNKVKKKLGSNKNN
ncbi:MAG: very short patch repair endonuclease [Deltaproteobacteria bacterium]|nr:very short patch repair endonuclease [Deltaproteobacteria bacterium]